MRQLHNELITSLYEGGLLGASNTNKNDVIISDTIICSLSPSQLCPMIENQKTMCGCAICNTSKHFQELLNTWRRKQLKS